MQELLHEFGSWEFSEHILLALLLAAQELPNIAVGVLLQMKSAKHVNDLRVWLANALKVNWEDDQHRTSDMCKRELLLCQCSPFVLSFF